MGGGIPNCCYNNQIQLHRLQQEHLGQSERQLQEGEKCIMKSFVSRTVQQTLR
jgi:hypothetical protein